MKGYASATPAEPVDPQVLEVEQRFRIMADAAPVLLWMSRSDGMCTFFNQTWLDFTGRTQEQEWGVGWAEGVHFEDLQNCLDTYMAAFGRREKFEMEYRLQRADGEFRWVLDRGTPRYMPDGTFAGYIGSCIDITDRKLAEAELHRNIRAKDEFLGLVSHELRTPVTALQLQIERLRRHGLAGLSDRERDVVSRISLTTERLAHMIESVLHVCRMESGKLKLEIAAFDLVKLCAILIDELRANADKKGIDLRLRAHSELPPLRSDAELVRMIVTNLVSNAIKFTDAGFVEVALESSSVGHVIVVRDSGRGIPPDQHARIFGVFERLEPSRQTHTPGVGLGLSLVRAMSTALGGRVAVQSELGRGSVFTVVLPSARLS
jgi:PAS domain S-box-containing protein